MKEAEILTAVRDKLKSIAKIPVYFDHVREGITSPCFFVALVDIASRNSFKLILHDCTLHVTYFVPKKTAKPLELYEMKDKLKDAFVNGLAVSTETEDGGTEERYIKFTSVSAELDGQDADLIYFDAPFLYYEGVSEKKPDYLIYEIHNDIIVKDDLKRLEE